jgi:hypothetical protein
MGYCDVIMGYCDVVMGYCVEIDEEINNFNPFLNKAVM